MVVVAVGIEMVDTVVEEIENIVMAAFADVVTTLIHYPLKN